ncbi:MAG: ABC transporter substrate-binding protein [Halobacteriaceae archaeon]
MMSHSRSSDCSSRVSRRTLLKSIGATGGIAAIAGCSQGGSSSKNKRPTIVWAGSNIGTDGFLARVAKNKKFVDNFEEKYSFDFKVKYFGAGSLEAAIAQGQVDTGNMAPPQAARVNNKLPNTRLVAMRPLYKIHEQIVVHPSAADKVSSSNIKQTLKDLQDLTIVSLGQGSSAYNLFSLFVSSYGLKIDNYDLRYMSPAAMMQQMIQGNADAMLSFNPLTAKLLARDRSYVVPHTYSEIWESISGHQLPIGEVTTYWSKIENEKQAWKDLNQMWNDIGAYVKNNTEKLFRRHREHYGLKTDEQLKIAKKKMKDLFYDSFNEDARKGAKAWVRESENQKLINNPNMEKLFVRPQNF